MTKVLFTFLLLFSVSIFQLCAQSDAANNDLMNLEQSIQQKEKLKLNYFLMCIIAC